MSAIPMPLGSLIAPAAASCNHYAIPLYRHAADAGDWHAAQDLVRLLAKRGDLDEAVKVTRALADAGDRLAALRLEGLLAVRTDLDELRARADASDLDAAAELGQPGGLPAPGLRRTHSRPARPTGHAVAHRCRRRY